MRKILVVNPKGGCGKTTIAINLASYYVNKGVSTTIIDLDHQRSSFIWCESRPDSVPEIKCNLDPLPEYQTKRVIFDCPAGIHLGLTTDLINQSDIIVMPINPSIIDHRAAFKFIFDIRKMIRADVCKKIQIGLVANRANQSFNSYQELERFAYMMKTPIIATLRNSQNYVSAVNQGLGIFDMSPAKVAKDREQWKALTYWAEGKVLKKRAL